MKTQTLKSGKREWVCEPPLEKHTPGPWRARQTYNNGEPAGIAVDAGCEPICETLTNDAVAQANARLIAAAPDLLLVAECITRGLTNGQKERGETLELLAHRAISKATGQA